MDKKTVRREMLEKRKRLSEKELLEFADQVLEKLVIHPKILKAKHIGLYYPIKNELNLNSLKDHFKDKLFYYPRMVNQHIQYFLVSDSNDFESTGFGLKEPKLTCPKKSILDVYIIPCIATDGLYRIGYGKGYFDQFLKDKKGYKFGITLPFSKLQLGLNESHDVILDEVI